MVFQSDGACTGVQQVEGLWCLSLLLCCLGRLCQCLCRAGTGRMPVCARPLWGLEVAGTAAGAATLSCGLQDVVSN